MADKPIPDAVKRRRKQLQDEADKNKPNANAEQEANAEEDGPDPLDFAKPGETDGEKVPQKPLEDVISKESSDTNTDDVSVEHLKRELERAHQRNSSLQGMFKDKEDKLASLTDEVGELKKLISVKKKEEAVTGKLPEVEALSPEELEQYKASLPVIEKVTRAAIRDMVEPMLRDIEDFKTNTMQTHESYSNRIEKLSEDTYTRDLYAAIPDLDTVVKEPKFDNYLSTVIPYSGGETVRERLAAAHRGSDLKTVRLIVQDYKSANAGSQDSGTNIGSFVQPQGDASGTRVSPDADPGQAKPMLAWSKRDEAFRQFRAGSISQEELNKIKAMFEEATLEDRVDFNA